MIQAVRVGNSTLYFNNSPSHITGEYYIYCCKLIIQSMSSWEKPLNVVVGPYNVSIEGDAPLVRIDIQPEHTLVKQGGRSVDEVIVGSVKVIDSPDENYLVRVPNFDYFNSIENTIEYSLPNIFNLKSCGVEKFDKYIRNAIYIAPILYDSFNFDLRETGKSISMFTSNASPRREEFMRCGEVENVQGVYNLDNLRNLYCNTKVLVNVHQTDHHHTFEELRVLPALCNGVLIVSEDVPLKDQIPYSDHIIWCSYGSLASKVKEVKDNYKEYHKKVFNNDLTNILLSLARSNKENIKKIGMN